MAHEEFKQREFFQGECDLDTIFCDSVPCRIKHNISDFERPRMSVFRASENRVDARDELIEGERLRDVVVGAAVEKINFVLGLVARSEHYYRCRDSGFAYVSADLIATDTGKHEIEKNEVVFILIEQNTCARLVTIRKPVHTEAFHLQASFYRFCQLGFIFDNQDSHRSI